MQPIHSCWSLIIDRIRNVRDTGDVKGHCSLRLRRVDATACYAVDARRRRGAAAAAALGRRIVRVDLQRSLLARIELRAAVRRVA